MTDKKQRILPMRERYQKAIQELLPDVTEDEAKTMARFVLEQEHNGYFRGIAVGRKEADAVIEAAQQQKGREE